MEATEELLRELASVNDLDPTEVAAAFFTTTPDLDAEFPAHAVRRLGWLDVPMLCGHDMTVQQPNPRGVAMCIRILLLYNTPRPQAAMLDSERGHIMPTLDRALDCYLGTRAWEREDAEALTT